MAWLAYGLRFRILGRLYYPIASYKGERTAKQVHRGRHRCLVLTAVAESVGHKVVNVAISGRNLTKVFDINLYKYKVLAVGTVTA